MSIYHTGKLRRDIELPVSEAEGKARVELAAAYRIFDMLGWDQLIFNHITLRVPGPEVCFLINPFGLHYREITASSLLLNEYHGNPLRETPWPVNPPGFLIPSAPPAAPPNAPLLMPPHTPTGMAVACLKEGLSPHNFYGAM